MTQLPDPILLIFKVVLSEISLKICSLLCGFVVPIPTFKVLVLYILFPDVAHLGNPPV